MATELIELEVDRVDAVKDPATKRKFLLLKSESTDELRLNAQRLADAALCVIEAVSKEKVSEDTAMSLRALGDLLEVKFKTKSEPEREPDMESKPEEGREDMKKEDMDAFKDDIKKAIADGFKDMVQSLRKQDTEPEPEPKSKENPTSEQAPAAKPAEDSGASPDQNTEPVSKQVSGSRPGPVDDVSFENIFFGKS